MLLSIKSIKRSSNEISRLDSMVSFSCDNSLVMLAAIVLACAPQLEETCISSTIPDELFPWITASPSKLVNGETTIELLPVLEIEGKIIW